MDFSEIYHFLFETVPGIAVLVGVGLVVSILVCAVLELKTRRRFRHRDEGAPDEWSIFGDDDDEDGEGAAR